MLPEYTNDEEILEILKELAMHKDSCFYEEVSVPGSIWKAKLYFNIIGIALSCLEKEHDYLECYLERNSVEAKKHFFGKMHCDSAKESIFKFKSVLNLYNKLSKTDLDTLFQNIETNIPLACAVGSNNKPMLQEQAS